MLRRVSLFEDHDGPEMIEPSVQPASLSDLVLADLPGYKQRLLERGAILFRGFDIQSVDDFHEFVTGYSDSHLRYMNRSTPRAQMTTNVYTATNYPRQQEIPLHSENSYQREWPMTVAFCCTLPAAVGGETPIASTREIVRSIGRELTDKFERLGIEYIRHYHDGIDLPWREVFQTGNRDDVTRYCTENGIECAWLEENLLRTSHVAQGIAEHPATGARVFFNQAHLFHVSSTGSAGAAALIQMFGDRLPRHARFGDGSEISAEELALVRRAFGQSARSFGWRRGDVLLLDNMQYAHGRRSYEGRRSVFAALMDPFPSPYRAPTGI